MKHPDLLRTPDEEYLDPSLRRIFYSVIMMWALIFGGIWLGFHVGWVLEVLRRVCD